MKRPLVEVKFEIEVDISLELRSRFDLDRLARPRLGNELAVPLTDQREPFELVHLAHSLLLCVHRLHPLKQAPPDSPGAEKAFYYTGRASAVKKNLRKNPRSLKGLHGPFVSPSG